MPSIRKRGNKWQARVHHNGAKPLVKTFTHKTDAQRWAREMQRQIDTGAIDQVSHETPLKPILLRYLHTVTPHKKGAQQERYRLIQLLRHPIASTALSSLTPEYLAGYRDDRLKEVSRSTVRIELSLLSSIFNQCRLEWGIDIANPVASIRRPRPTPGRNRRLCNQEEANLVMQCDASRASYLGAFVRLALATGMRFGELASLQWEQVSLERGEIRLLDTKNGHPRVVPLGDVATRIMSTLPKGQSSRVFPAAAGSIKTAFRLALAKAQRANPGMLVGLRFHDLRHEATSRLFEQGLNVFEAASVTGHRSVTMLARYTHVLPEMTRKKLR